MKINLSEYPTAGKIAAQAAARAAENGHDSIFTTTTNSTPPNHRNLIRQGRRSWIEFWQQLLTQHTR